MRGLLATLCAATLSLASPVARAAAAPPAAESPEQLYEEGRKDYRLGRFQDAIDKWEKAYAIAELPLLLYNIALAYRQLYDVSADVEDLRKGKVVLKNFLVASLVFTLAHGVFLAFILGSMLPESVNRQDVLSGVQWMLGAQVASLLLDLWRIGGWPFAEIRVYEGGQPHHPLLVGVE